MVLADEEACGLGHIDSGTEHLLLGLLREQQGVAVRVMEALNVAPERVREQVVRCVGSDEAGMGERRPLTPRSRRVLEIGLEQALRLGHDYVDVGQSFWGSSGVRGGRGPGPLQAGRESGRDLPRGGGAGFGTQDTAVGGAGRAADPPRATTIRARAAGLVVRARCGVTDEELALPQALRVDLDYLYEAGEGNDLYGALD